MAINIDDITAASAGMGVELDAAALLPVILVSLLFGAIGFVYWRFGKKRDKTVMRWSGVALMVYPYVVWSLWPLIAVGVVLVALPFVIRD